MSEEIARAFYAAYAAHDTEGVRGLYAPDATHEDVAFGKPKSGRDAIVAGLALFLTWFPDAKWSIADQVISASTVATTYLLTGHLQADLGNTPGKGQAISLRGVQILKIENGRIVRSEDYWDAETFKRQINTH
ncbi:ester cyclase [Methylobacterium sp. C1]|uniref:ester cyclase n=1 Tax=Methylobacterium sp. C1 TaxID=1479019 RepID=UPI0009F237FC|nr:ester cyclase [Methylobacterium sp. C1]